MINPLAQELNDALKGTTPGELLSDVGTRLYFPKGIIAQSAEAKKLGKTANGTIGTTVVEGKPIMLPSIKKYVPDLTSSELVGYAPTAGNPFMRAKIQKKFFKGDPGLETRLNKEYKDKGDR